MVLTCSPRPMRLRGCRLFRRGARAFPFRLRSRSPSPRPAQAPQIPVVLGCVWGVRRLARCWEFPRLRYGCSSLRLPRARNVRQPSNQASAPSRSTGDSARGLRRPGRRARCSIPCCAVSGPSSPSGSPSCSWGYRDRPTCFRPRVRGTQLYVDCEMRRLSGLSPRGRGGDDLGPLGASAQTGSSPRAGRRSHHQSHRLRNSRIIPARGEITIRRRARERCAADYPRAGRSHLSRLRRQLLDPIIPACGEAIGGLLPSGYVFRIIPARGEATASSQVSTGPAADCPRSRGGDIQIQDAVAVSHGLSPSSGEHSSIMSSL